MCIRDRIQTCLQQRRTQTLPAHGWRQGHGTDVQLGSLNRVCLLYTSDAADERSSVDLGGRRIINKKKKKELARPHTSQQNNDGTHEQMCKI